MKRILIILLGLTACLLPMKAEGTRAYKSMRDTYLFHETKKGNVEKGTAIQKGDTVYATEATEKYVLENKDKRIIRIPVEYKGEAGLIDFIHYYPIKLDDSDVLTFVCNSSLGSQTPIERFMTPTIDKAINYYSGPTRWLYAILICTGLNIVFLLLATNKKAHTIGLILTALSLTALSVFEVLYQLSFSNNLSWFIMPSYIGGWGYTILNFLLLIVVIGVQILGLYYVWSEALDSDETSPAPDWLKNLSFLPVVIGVVLLIIGWIDNGTFPGSVYLWVMSPIALAAIGGMIWLFVRKQVFPAIVYPVLFFVSSIGLVLGIMLMSIWLLIAAVVGVVAFIALSIVWGALFGGKRIKGRTKDGRIINGIQNRDGTVKGDDGNTYTID